MTDPSDLYRNAPKQVSPKTLDEQILAAANVQSKENAVKYRSKKSYWMPSLATAAVLVIGITFINNPDLTDRNEFVSEDTAGLQETDFQLLDSEEASDQGVVEESLEEVVVTARKREESIQDVPLSILSKEQKETEIVAANEADIPLAISPSFDTQPKSPAPATAGIEIATSEQPREIPIDLQSVAIASHSDQEVSRNSQGFTTTSALENTEETEHIGSLAGLSDFAASTQTNAEPELAQDEKAAGQSENTALEAKPDLYAAADTESRSEGLEEVIVTARKRRTPFWERVGNLFSGNNENASETRTKTTMIDPLVDVTEIIPDIILDLRYTGSNNFVGEPIDGYLATKALLTPEAAQALLKVQEELRKNNLGLVIFDAYRPQRAVDHFIRWQQLPDDSETKAIYYPNIYKNQLFSAGYLAERSSHSRGSTVDVTVAQVNKDGSYEILDMGTIFDFFDPTSWPGSIEVSAKAQANRKLLNEVMTNNGFVPFETEWWHFTLNAEPYSDTYFDIVIGE